MSDEDTSLTGRHLKRARNGDAASLVWLGERLYPFTVGYVRYRYGRRLKQLQLEAEEVASYAYMILQSRLGDVRPRDGRFGMVVRRLLRSVVDQHVRNQGKTQSRNRLETGPRDPEAPDVIAELPDGRRASPIEEIRRSEIARRILQVLQSLSAEDRAILLMRYFEEHSWDQIAQAVNSERAPERHASVVTLRQRCHRVRQALRQQVPPEVVDELLEPLPEAG